MPKFVGGDKKLVGHEDVSDDKLFIEWCSEIEWASAGRPDGRDALLVEVVRKAKELLVKS